MPPYARMAHLRTPEEFRAYAAALGISLPVDEQIIPAPDGPLAQPYTLKNGRRIGNRFCILPMEGWDGTPSGAPTDNTLRRWENFGRSGAKLIWGGEAVAVCHEGRANPNQLMIQPHTLAGLDQLRRKLLQTHAEQFSGIDDLLIGLQLTHSGRFSRPNQKTRLEPKILYHHPLLEEIYKTDPDLPVMTDTEIEGLIGNFILAAKRAHELGFAFVDIKHCHGYLGHEFLSAFSRPGPYGGSFENRTRFLRSIIAGIRGEAPGLLIGVRLSAYDFPPFRPGPDGIGRPLTSRDPDGDYRFAFGGDPQDPLRIKAGEVIEFLDLLQSLGVELVNLTAGSPYYNPHIQRPALFPPSDGYLPPEDPLAGVSRQINHTAMLKARFPGLAISGSGYSYLQEWLPHAAQHAVRTGMTDFVGLGRMVLSYPRMPADVLAGHALDRRRICRTFSDCTTAPRIGLVSGCYPLDAYYKQTPEAGTLKKFKTQARPDSKALKQ